MHLRFLTGRKGVLFGTMVLAALAAAPSLLGSKYDISLLVECLIWALFAMSLDLLLGYMGHASFGHAAFFGTAAYVLALLNVRFNWSFLPAVLGALLVTLAVAALFGLVVSHMSGMAYLMVNFALAQVVWGLAYQWDTMTGGDNGIQGVARPSFWGLDFSQISIYYYLVLVVFVLCTLALLLLVSSPFGMSIKAIKQSPSRMRVLGFNVWLHKYITYIIAGFFAGVAGIMLASFNSFVGAGDLDLLTNSRVVLMVLVGGAGTLFGPMLGGALVVVLEAVISAFTDRWPLVMGIMYIAVVLFLPGGLLGLGRAVRRPRSTPEPDDDAAPAETLTSSLVIGKRT